MKKNISIIFLVAFTIVALTLFMIYVNKNNNKISRDEKYQNLFGSAILSDGAYAEGYFSELSKLFLEDPEYFVEQLSLLKEAERQSISFHTAFDMYIGEPEINNKHEMALYNLRQKSNNSEFNSTLNNLIKDYESIKEDNEKSNN